MARVETEEWYTDYDTVVSFGEVLHEIDLLSDAKDVLAYFAKPWKYDNEFEAWDAAKRPTDGRALSDFVDELNEQE